MAHGAILKAVLHYSKKMDLNPARPCGAIQVSMSCRALWDHIPKCPDSPWACAVMCSGDSSEQTPPGDTTSHRHQTHWHSLFGNGISGFLSRLRTSIFSPSSDANISSLMRRFFIFWQYPEAYQQKPVCFGSPAFAGSLTLSERNTVTQGEQVCCKSHCLSK